MGREWFWLIQLKLRFWNGLDFLIISMKNRGISAKIGQSRSKMVNSELKTPDFWNFQRKIIFITEIISFLFRNDKISIRGIPKLANFNLVWLFLPFLANFGQIAKIILLRYKNYIACMLFIYLCTNPAILLLPLVVIVSENFSNFQSPKRHFFRYDSGHKESPEKVMQNFVEIEIGAFESCGRKFYKKNKISLFSPKIAKNVSKNGSGKARFWSEIAKFDSGITKIRIVTK